MSTAGTYTVTASYTENGITAIATYSLTVNKAWSQIWSGNKSKTMTPTSSIGKVNVYTSTLTGTQTLRVTYSSSGSGGDKDRVNLYCTSNASTTLIKWTKTKPSSPVQISVDMGKSRNYYLAICRSNSSSYVSGPAVSFNYDENTKTFYLYGTLLGSLVSGSVTLTITKIERYY